MKYVVYVDDNYHLGDEEERYKLGEYNSCQEAVLACKKIVDEFMTQGYKDDISFNELLKGYKMYGEDPFILSGDTECRFSAWSYAEKRCLELFAT